MIELITVEGKKYRRIQSDDGTCNKCPFYPKKQMFCAYQKLTRCVDDQYHPRYFDVVLVKDLNSNIKIL